MCGRTFSLREDLEIIARRSGRSRGLDTFLHPFVPALCCYRIAHSLHARHRILARLLSNVGRLASGGIEIHPAAVLGRRLFIEHGTGVVIGETAVVGDDVTLCQQVTLGAIGWWRDNERAPGQRRHPRLGDHVVVGPNATLLGPTSIGDGAVIGPQALVVTDVPPGTRVHAPRAVVTESPGNRLTR